MRAWTVLLTLALLSTGCLGSNAVEPQAAPEDTGTPAPSEGTQGAEASNTSQPTYLQNQDYDQAHLHDYWNGAERLVLMDEVLSTHTSTSLATTLFAPFTGEPRTGVGVLPFTLPNGTFVPEGTGEVLVEVDATTSLENGEIQLGYRAANQAEMAHMEPGPAQASWTIETTPPMADLPHAKSTRWAFQLSAQGPGAGLDGDVAIRVTAIRVHEITAWPAHDDAWQAGTIEEIHLANVTGTYDYASQHLFQPADADYEVIDLPQGTIVPPETQALVVTMHYERDEGDPKNRLNGPVILIVKVGSNSRGYTVMHGNAIEDVPGKVVYAIPVDGSNQDSPYADQSGWRFRLHAPMGYHDDERTIDIGGMDLGSGSYDVGVDAYRVLPAWLEEVLPEDIGR
ncbi:MAG: hypothetical protein R3185_04255 [Candidatus Thermoplasmatota archaeon]|nr:hypothetical protein [Candidatus Thermoplasmatota archaeon]